MYAIAFKIVVTLGAALAVGAGVALFTIARQDGSRAGQILGVAIPIVAMVVAIYLVR
jgi:hypothetical protein